MEQKIYCNVCGKTIVMKNGILKEDMLEITKDWGYFSKKDMQRHSFKLCEECYDKWIKTFAVPVEVSQITEAM